MRLFLSILIAAGLWAMPAFSATVQPPQPGGPEAGPAPAPAAESLLNDYLAFAFPQADGGMITGSVRNAVVRAMPGGPLSFAPQIAALSNDSSAAIFRIMGFSLRGFGDVTLDEKFDASIAPQPGSGWLTRSADGKDLTFTLDRPLAIAQGASNDGAPTPVLHSTATDFATTGELVIYGMRVDNPTEVQQTTLSGLAVPAFDDSTKVPVPPAFLLLLTGLGALSITRRRPAA